MPTHTFGFETIDLHFVIDGVIDARMEQHFPKLYSVSLDGKHKAVLIGSQTVFVFLVGPDGAKLRPHMTLMPLPDTTGKEIVNMAYDGMQIALIDSDGKLYIWRFNYCCWQREQVVTQPEKECVSIDWLDAKAPHLFDRLQWVDRKGAVTEYIRKKISSTEDSFHWLPAEEEPETSEQQTTATVA